MKIIDLLAVFRETLKDSKRTLYFESNGHTNVEGHQLIADELLGVINPWLDEREKGSHSVIVSVPGNKALDTNLD